MVAAYSLTTGSVAVSGFSLATGALFACGVTLSMVLYMTALGLGEVSVTGFIYSCGFLIPTVSGILFWHEEATATKIAGILLLTAAFFCIGWSPRSKTADRPPEKRERSSRVRWLITSFAAMAASGGLGVIQKTHQNSVHKGEYGCFLSFGMFIAAAVCLTAALIFRRERREVSFNGKMTAMAVSCGIFYGTANIINLLLAGAIPATIQFPLVNGGNIVLTAVLGRVIFGERLTWLRRAGILTGILAIFVISR